MNREVLLATLRAAGYECADAADGQEGWEILDAHPSGYDVVLLDRRMPRLDGMGLLSRLKGDSRLRDIPVIMQTANASAEEVADGISAGVHYYLGKPLDRKLLLSVTAAAIDEHRRVLRLREDLAKRASAIGLMDQGVFRFRTLAEAEILAAALAQGWPRAQRLAMGLTEIFTNAIEHGNLAISYSDKDQLIEAKNWDEEIAERLEHPENRDKYVTVTVERAPGEIRITVRDQGRGFDWRGYMELDPARAFSAHGRGIAMARRLAFDHLEYHDPGNEVLCILRDPSIATLAPPTENQPDTTDDAGSSLRASADEVAQACRMQADLLPQAAGLAWIERCYGAHITTHFQPSGPLGGDIWGMDTLGSHSFALWLADFSGHGVVAALNTFRLHTMIEQMTAGRDRPAVFLAEINQRLVGLLPVGQYATMLYGIVDREAGRFVYAAAAAPRPLVAAPGRAVQIGNGAGLPLGVRRAATYVERSLPLSPGSTLFLASDALQECRTPDTPLGSGGVVDLVQQAVDRHGPNTDIASILGPFLTQHGTSLADDLTAICCRIPAG